MPARLKELTNRLQKNLRHRRKWARRQDITCYRVYDRDLPDFALTIDWYQGRLHVQAFDRPAPNRDAHPADILRHSELSEILQQVFELPAPLISFKTRQRQRGGNQYRRMSDQEAPFVVQEGGLSFQIDLSRYLDTGLFLDHRQTRALVRDKAAGVRFLNLFAYSGSFTVYAAAGGAAETVSVDLSRTYQQWTLQNLRLNGLDDDRHQLVQSDVLAYLDRSRRKSGRFNLILLDPPSFSNSKRMRGSLDVQRDHSYLIRGCLALLAPGGELLFSTNRRRFKLDPELERTAVVKEISRLTVPDDFKRHPPHRCWTLQQR